LKEKCSLNNKQVLKKSSKKDKDIKTSSARKDNTSSTQDLVQENIDLQGNTDQVLEEEVDIPQDLGHEEMPPHEGDGTRVPNPAEAVLPDDNTVRGSNRTWKPTRRFLECIEQEGYAIPVGLQAFVYNTECKTIVDNVNPMCLLLKTDGDTMYRDKAIKQHDKEEFLKAAILEIRTHQENGHWKVIPRGEVPVNQPVLDAGWSMKRKRRPRTNELY
jgi:hypothetical protein